MSESSYPKFCPVAMAASLLEPRWTMLVLCEMWSGSSRFSEIQRGVPGISPALLTKRLREMEENGLLVRGGGRGAHREYLTTPLADELEPLVQALGEWAHRNIDSELSLRHLDARVLMWNLRRKIDLLKLPKGRSVIQFVLSDPPKGSSKYWVVAKPGKETDLCYTDPKLDVDLFVVCELRALTSAWMGHSSFEDEIEAGRVSLMGQEQLARTFTKWVVRSSFASVAKADIGCGRKDRMGSPSQALVSGSQAAGPCAVRGIDSPKTS